MLGQETILAIHHPSGDVKKITAGPAPTTMDSCIATTTTANTHWMTGPYTQGTTEGGSSGSGLFAVAGSGGIAHHLIGTLSGGTAACSDAAPGQPNDGFDCYGKLSVAWNGASASSRLRDWLDPGHTGATSADGIDQNDVVQTGDGHSTHAWPSELLQRPRATGAQR